MNNRTNRYMEKVAVKISKEVTDSLKVIGAGAGIGGLGGAAYSFLKKPKDGSNNTLKRTLKNTAIGAGVGAGVGVGVGAGTTVISANRRINKDKALKLEEIAKNKENKEYENLISNVIPSKFQEIEKEYLKDYIRYKAYDKLTHGLNYDITGKEKILLSKNGIYVKGEPVVKYKTFDGIGNKAYADLDGLAKKYVEAKGTKIVPGDLRAEDYDLILGHHLKSVGDKRADRILSRFVKKEDIDKNHLNEYNRIMASRKGKFWNPDKDKSVVTPKKEPVQRDLRINNTEDLDKFMQGQGKVKVNANDIKNSNDFNKFMSSKEGVLTFE